VTQTITIADLLRSAERVGLDLHLVEGRGHLARRITSADLHRPGLALVGHYFHEHPERIQVLGETEVTFLQQTRRADREAVYEHYCEHGVPCFVVTRGLQAPPNLRAVARRYGVPVLRTQLSTGRFIRKVALLLDELMAPTTILHGVMVDIFGVGVLISGPSGIGKSECALELVLRGHRLVADDMVEIRLRRPTSLIARGVEMIKHHMEIRGLGIINVQDLYGVAAVRDDKRLELVVESAWMIPNNEKFWAFNWI